MKSAKGVFILWFFLSIGILVNMASTPQYAGIDRPWPGYIGVIMISLWVPVSVLSLLGINPKRLVRRLLVGPVTQPKKGDPIPCMPMMTNAKLQASTEKK